MFGSSGVNQLFSIAASVLTLQVLGKTLQAVRSCGNKAKPGQDRTPA